MGTIKTTNIETITGSGTLTIGQSGETITIPSGATLNLSNATQTGVGGTNTPNFSAYRSTNQTISNATDTVVVYNVEVFDTDSAFDTSNGKFTVPSGKGGKYMFVGQTQWNSATDFDDTNISICVNGTRIFYGDVGRNEFYRTNRVVALLNLSASDYVEIKVFQAVGGNLDIQGSSGDRSYFYGYKIIE